MNFFNPSLNSAFSEGLYAWLVVHLDNSVVHSSLSAVLFPWDSWAWLVMLVTAELSSSRVQPQAHTGRGEKVTGRIWEGSVWASLTPMNREELNSFQLGLVLHWEWMFLLSSSGLYNPFHACLIPFETKAIRHLTKQILFSFCVWVDFYFSKSVGFNPISCFGERREQVTNKT